MGSEQASETLLHVQKRSADRKMTSLSPEETNALKTSIKESYERQMDIRYGAARGWIDALIDPRETRETLIQLFNIASRGDFIQKSFHTGVFQV